MDIVEGSSVQPPRRLLRHHWTEMNNASGGGVATIEPTPAPLRPILGATGGSGAAVTGPDEMCVTYTCPFSPPTGPGDGCDEIDHSNVFGTLLSFKKGPLGAKVCVFVPFIGGSVCLRCCAVCYLAWSTSRFGVWCQDSTTTREQQATRCVRAPFRGAALLVFYIVRIEENFDSIVLLGQKRCR
jgi:hypothetical protein